jgi:hypothetical protein
VKPSSFYDLVGFFMTAVGFTVVIVWLLNPELSPLIFASGVLSFVVGVYLMYLVARRRR